MAAMMSRTQWVMYNTSNLLWVYNRVHYADIIIQITVLKSRGSIDWIELSPSIYVENKRCIAINGLVISTIFVTIWIVVKKYLSVDFFNQHQTS